MITSDVASKMIEIEDRRQHKGWEVKTPSGKARTPLNPTLHRCLSLRYLEIPVQEWTEDFIMDQPDDPRLGIVLGILGGHAQDEDKHDAQLCILADYWKAGVLDHEFPDVPDEADKISKAWMEFECPSIVKKMVLESGVFFPILGMMARYAPEDLFTQSVREWITSDENAHVASSRVLIRSLNLKIPSGLTDLVRGTINFLTRDLPEQEQAKWVRLSDNGLRSGRLGNELGISVVPVPEAFTQTRNHRIPYQIPQG